MTDPGPSRSRNVTERQVCSELGIEQIELYLAAAHCKAGDYDSITHLLMFSDKEVDALAACLGATRRRRTQLTDAQRAAAPEPTGE